MLFQSRRDLQCKFKKENYFLLQLWEVSKSHNGEQLSPGEVEEEGEKLKDQMLQLRDEQLGFQRMQLINQERLGHKVADRVQWTQVMKAHLTQHPQKQRPLRLRSWIRSRTKPEDIVTLPRSWEPAQFWSPKLSGNVRIQTGGDGGKMTTPAFWLTWAMTFWNSSPSAMILTAKPSWATWAGFSKWIYTKSQPLPQQMLTGPQD